MAVSFTSPAVAAASSGGLQITAHASNNTKGNYGQIVASLAADCMGMVIGMGDSASGDWLIDIATGAAASEVVIIANIHWGRQQSRQKEAFFIPFKIAAGTRLAARCQCTTGGSSMDISVTFVHAWPLSVPTVATTYGAATGDSGGVSVDPGASANTKGAYSEITAATTGVIKWLLVCVGNQNNGAETAAGTLLDIATGAAAAEVVLIPDIHIAAGTVADVKVPHYFSVPCDIPSGTRIAARAQSSTNDATDRLLDVSVIGFGPNMGIAASAQSHIGI